jgi:hypothetical protein
MDNNQNEYFSSLLKNCDGCPNIEDCIDKALANLHAECEHWARFNAAYEFAEKYIREYLYEEITKYIKEEPKWPNYLN